jgi:hypothetical protein
MRGGTLEATANEPGAQVNVDPAAFMAAVVAAVKRGDPPAEAIQQAAREHLGVIGESDVVGRVTLAIARDFDGEHPGADVAKDGMALTRIAEGYVKALPSLRETGKAEMNLPFLGVASSGPVHLIAPLTPARIAELLARPVRVEAAPARAPDPEPARAGVPVEPAPKKKGWWPFGG